EEHFPMADAHYPPLVVVASAASSVAEPANESARPSSELPASLPSATPAIEVSSALAKLVPISKPAVASPSPAPVSRPTLEDVRDDVDEQVLPIFLEEAAELFPQAGEQLRLWRRNPANNEHAHALRRVLHTFKGSARMAGAMRLGELTHGMESRLLIGDSFVKPTADLFEALDTDLDHLAFVLDHLQKGEVNTALPWASAEVVEAALSPASDALIAAAPVVAPRAIAAQAPVHASFEPEAAQRAMLRVRADLIDRLV